ncbi:MAG: L-rhamnonate dehydratase [Planctomycetota bacterium]
MKTRVKAVRAYVAETRSGADYHAQQGGHWIADSIIANPMSVHADYKARRTSWGIDALGTAVVEIEADSGVIGIGATTGGIPVCYLIEKHLKRFVLGRDPRDTESIWDQMFRASLYYGRKGLAIHAISAIDLALWDLLGRLRGEPVYALVGGKTKDRLPTYATTPRPDLAKELGFFGAKLPLPFGPVDGKAGLEQNRALAERARDQVGKSFDLMFDCYMALDVPYTIELCRAIEPYQFRWVEEFLPPDDYDGYAQVRAAVRSTRLTTGEHEYTRFGFRELLRRHCADILQPDLMWCGGLSEALKIAALAATEKVEVVPHGSGAYSYHFVLATSNAPFAEFLVMSPSADRIVPVLGNLFTGEPLPENGFIAVSERPGFGVDIDRSRVQLSRPFAD